MFGQTEIIDPLGPSTLGTVSHAWFSVSILGELEVGRGLSITTRVSWSCEFISGNSPLDTSFVMGIDRIDR